MTTIFNVCASSRTTGQHFFTRSHSSLKGAQEYIDKLKKEVSSIGWVVIADLWRNDNENNQVHCYRLLKIKTIDENELWYQIEANNLYD